MTIEVKEGYSIDPAVLQVLYAYAPWAKERTIEEIRTLLDNTDYHFTAWKGEKLVGFARVLTDTIFRATLWDVIVHPDHQNQGVGEELMNRVLSHPVLSNVEKVWLNTRDKSAFYEKFGFSRSHEAMVRINPKKERSTC
jgi:ribosomal protein S18 acetylase RimI-like enzyme